MTTIRVVTFNTLFGGHDDAGLGAGDRWRGQVPFLKELGADVLALQLPCPPRTVAVLVHANRPGASSRE